MAQDIHRHWSQDDAASIVRHTSDPQRVSDMHIWCEEHCSGNFAVHYYGKAPVTLLFESEQDAILFALSWS